MPKKIITSDEVTIAEANKFMEKAKDDLSEFQRRTYDYTIKFTKTDVKIAQNLVKKLEKKFNLSKKEVIQVTNCLPKTIEELRSILTVKGKVILTSDLEKMLSIINEAAEKAELKKSKKKEKSKSKT